MYFPEVISIESFTDLGGGSRIEVKTVYRSGKVGKRGVI